MAHNKTERDGMFTVRKPSWHGLEDAVLSEYPTLEEAKKIAHDWEAIPEPVYRKIPVINADGTLEERYEEVEGFKLNARSDDGGTLGVVRDTFTLVSNQTLYDIAEAIEGEAKGSVQLETGGSLLGGRKVWLLIKLRDPLVITDDPHGAVIPYYALQNAHDGSASFRGQATFTRIVCDNTAQMADLDAEQRGTQLMFQHTAGITAYIEQAKEALAGWRDSVSAYRSMMTHLRGLPITREQQMTFVEEFMPEPMERVITERVRNNIEKSRNTFLDILHGETCEGIDLTAYGLVQASIEYLNHGRRAHTQQSRFRRSYLNQDVLVTQAKDLALSIAAG